MACAALFGKSWVRVKIVLVSWPSSTAYKVWPQKAHLWFCDDVRPQQVVSNGTRHSELTHDTVPPHVPTRCLHTQLHRHTHTHTCEHTSQLQAHTVHISSTMALHSAIAACVQAERVDGCMGACAYHLVLSGWLVVRTHDHSMPVPTEYCP